MSLYLSVDDEIESKKKKEMLPELSQGMKLSANRIEPKQHFTLPPPRFSEASLVKELEENGIGRPSTYASILTTIRDKGYVEMVKGYFRPNELGFIVNDLIVNSFPDLVNVDFTAKMEDNLDHIEAAEMDYLGMLSRFYKGFQKQLDTAGESMLSMRGEGLPTQLICPKCNRKLHIKMGRNGHFLACIGYPDCTYTSNYYRDDKGNIQVSDPPVANVTETNCKKCGQPMALKQGRYGSFLACTGYPKCKNTQSINSNGAGKETGVNCPEKDCDGQLVQKTSKKGNVFYGCNRYPDCEYAIWNKPIPKPCPHCGAAFLTEKTTKKKGAFNICVTSGCAYKEY
jgi:DNA topoisomerase-1